MATDVTEEELAFLINVDHRISIFDLKNKLGITEAKIKRCIKERTIVCEPIELALASGLGRNAESWVLARMAISSSIEALLNKQQCVLIAPYSKVGADVAKAAVDQLKDKYDNQGFWQWALKGDVASDVSGYATIQTHKETVGIEHLAINFSGTLRCGQHMFGSNEIFMRLAVTINQCSVRYDAAQFILGISGEKLYKVLSFR